MSAPTPKHPQNGHLCSELQGKGWYLFTAINGSTLKCYTRRCRTRFMWAEAAAVTPHTCLALNNITQKDQMLSVIWTIQTQVDDEKAELTWSSLLYFKSSILYAKFVNVKTNKNKWLAYFIVLLEVGQLEFFMSSVGGNIQSVVWAGCVFHRVKNYCISIQPAPFP